MVITGKREPYGRPSSGCGDAGPVEGYAYFPDLAEVGRVHSSMTLFDRIDVVAPKPGPSAGVDESDLLRW